MPESIDRRAARLAGAQHGAFSRTQALALGATDALIHRRVATGRWERVHAGVYRLADWPPSWRQLVIAACLAWGAGAVASHLCAAALWRLLGFEPGPVELIVPRGRAGRGPGIVHRPRSFPAVDATVVDAIPVTTPARTLLDVASVVPANVLEEALDDALRRRLASLSRLRWRLREEARSGRPGIAQLRAALEARPRATAVPQSVLETRVLRLLKAAGLPDPVVQCRVRGGRRPIVVEFAYPGERVAIEAEGYKWHGSRVRFERDLARRNALTALGWRVIHVTWADLTDHEEETIRVVEEALRGVGRSGLGRPALKPPRGRAEE